MIRGRRRDVGLGGFPLVSLKEARDKAFANRKAARQGGDPVADRQRPDTVPTFAAAAERVWTDKHPGWRHPRHAHDWMSSLTRHVLPHIGDTPVSSVSNADVLDTLRRIWHIRPETARRVRQRISAVMDWAVAMEYRSDNPCDRLGPVLGPQQDLVEHMRALPHGEVAAAIRTMGASGATPVVKLAFELLVLTAARTGGEDAPRGEDARRRPRAARVPRPGRQADQHHAAAAAASRSQGGRRAARLPVIVPGLGRGTDGIIRARWSRRRSRMWWPTRPRRPTPARICSSADGG